VSVNNSPAIEKPAPTNWPRGCSSSRSDPCATSSPLAADELQRPALGRRCHVPTRRHHLGALDHVTRPAACHMGLHQPPPEPRSLPSPVARARFRDDSRALADSNATRPSSRLARCRSARVMMRIGILEARYRRVDQKGRFSSCRHKRSRPGPPIFSSPTFARSHQFNHPQRIVRGDLCKARLAGISAKFQPESVSGIF
jgi:hypothetical protein